MKTDEIPVTIQLEFPQCQDFHRPWPVLGVNRRCLGWQVERPDHLPDVLDLYSMLKRQSAKMGKAAWLPERIH